MVGRVRAHRCLAGGRGERGEFMFRYMFIALAVAFGLAAGAGAEEMITDGIAAQVGPDIVLVSEVMERVRPIEAEMRASDVSPAEIAKLRAMGLEKLIESRLIDQTVRRGELYATDEEIENAINGIAKENGLTREQLEESVAAKGLSADEYRAEIKTGIEHQKVIHMVVASKIDVQESEVRALYYERFSDQPKGGEMVHLRQILITPGGVVAGNKQPACARAFAARDRIRAGEAFEKVAAEVSEVAPAQGGEIGWLHSDSVASWMSAVVDPLEVGETSDVIELPFGCSLLKLVERRQFEPISYEDAKTQLHMEIYQQYLDKAFRAWMEELRAQTFIERKGHFAEAAMLGSQSGYAGEAEAEEDSRF
jgi:peptidyl-prolyl cis-trans isomerase SurA